MEAFIPAMTELERFLTLVRVETLEAVSDGALDAPERRRLSIRMRGLAQEALRLLAILEPGEMTHTVNADMRVHLYAAAPAMYEALRALVELETPAQVLGKDYAIHLAHEAMRKAAPWNPSSAQ